LDYHTSAFSIWNNDLAGTMNEAFFQCANNSSSDWQCATPFDKVVTVIKQRSLVAERQKRSREQAMHIMPDKERSRTVSVCEHAQHKLEVVMPS
jgi:hypothetical protein